MNPSLLGLTLPELRQEIVRLGEPAYRSEQVYQWLYEKGATSFDDMSNLSKPFRERLSEHFTLDGPKVEKFVSTDGTIKFRFTLPDGGGIESVWIPEAKRNTLCISSQVGCPLKCAFCVTGAIGYSRNLTAAEIVAQVRQVKVLEKLPLTNVVYMGMGEPLLNLENVLTSIAILSEQKGLSIGQRKITVSTVGMVPNIKRLVQETGVRLAVSLTGTTDKARDHWMPINKKYDLNTLKKELQNLNYPPGKEIMFEVVLMKGETDSLEQAEELAKFLKGLPAKVNLIPYNANEYFPELYEPTRKDVEAYQTVLFNHGIRTFIRKNRGRDVMAACGQLAGRSETAIPLSVPS